MEENYPVSKVRVPEEKADVINFISNLKNKPKIYFEIGTNIGSTAKKVRKILPGDSKMYLFDFEINKQYVSSILSENTIFFSSDHEKIYDSYNWHLMYLFEKKISPDFVFIDGKHTFDVDWLCFFLIDNMILKNGYIYFDDYDWSIKNSITLSPEKFPNIKNQYTDDQIKNNHIKILIDNFVKKKYKEITQNKLYQKI